MTDYKALYEAEVLKNKRLIQKCNTSIVKRKEIEKKIPELLEQERYMEREANERDWNDKSEEQVEELQEKIKCLERLNMKTPTQGFRLVIEQENEQLKKEINGDGLLKQGYKTELSNSHKQQNRMVKEIVKLKAENEKLKAEQFDDMEELAKSDGMCLVDIKIFDKLIEENEQLKEENKKLQKYADIMGDIDGDDLTNLLQDYGWEYNDDGELVKESDR